MSKFFLSTATILFLLFLSACSSDEQNANDANAMVSTNEYVLDGLNKEQYVLIKSENGFYIKGAKEKILMLDIFATWCPPCQAEAPHLSSLQEKFKNDLLIIGVSVEDGIENVKLLSFAQEYKAEYPMVNSAQNRRLISTVADQLKLGRNFGIPLMALYKDGKLINYYQGATEEEFIQSDIEKALGK
ncbi:MAG: TlpA family protein disulfide reductase [Campylobacterales bacterium]|nr:TlpA family protein disulfide reductase [Campylobacterales bacterium]